MADLPSHPDTGDEPGDLRATTGRQHWKTVGGVAIGIVLVVLFVVLHLTGVVGAGAH